MDYNLSNLKPPKGSRHKKVRVGRGIGSKTRPRTAGKGGKGQKSRSRLRMRDGFEGGRYRCIAATQSAGFRHPRLEGILRRNIDALNVFPAGETVHRRCFALADFYPEGDTAKSRFWVLAI